MADDLLKSLLETMKLNPDPTDKNGGPNEDLNDDVQTYSTEYENLDSTLDQLDSCLDSLEAQNDNLYSRLQELLVESRQTRSELEAERTKGGDLSLNDREDDKNDQADAKGEKS